MQKVIYPIHKISLVVEVLKINNNTKAFLPFLRMYFNWKDILL